VSRSQIFVPVFPGTNCDAETTSWVTENLDAHVVHDTADPQFQLESLKAIVIPGGFTYGDYLRAGAIAAQSPALRACARARELGVPILGICNGFQILCESHILPGALTRNTCHHHLHGPVRLQLQKAILHHQGAASSPWLPHFSEDKLASFFSASRMPISCGMGAFVPPAASLLRQEWSMAAQQNAPLAEGLTNRFSSHTQKEGGIIGPPVFSDTVIQDCAAHGFLPLLHYVHNEPGSAFSIAAILSTDGTVVGIMPHPERASDLVLGEDAGLIFLLGLARSRAIAIRPNSPLASFSLALTGEAA
jgi:phosphoribosylformylglycinamidine (FGAM) synthase-like amidotransferase family enzyme